MANEVIETTGSPVADAGESGTILLARAEIDQLIATSRMYPRDIQAATKSIMAYATMSKDAAASMLYRLSRKDKKTGEDKSIEGPGIRFAEALAQSWGNFRVAQRIIEINRKDKHLIVEGVFLDTQTNGMTAKRVQRGIRTSGGYLYSDDMINVTANAAGSIAIRNAILAGIPRMVWWPAYEAALKKVAGTAAEAPDRLARALAWFVSKGADEVSVLSAIFLEDKSEVLPDHIVKLEGMRASLINGEATLDDLLGRTREAEHAVVDNPLEDGPAKGKKEKAA